MNLLSLCEYSEIYTKVWALLDLCHSQESVDSDFSELHAVVFFVVTAFFDELFMSAPLFDTVFVQVDDLVGAKDC